MSATVVGIYASTAPVSWGPWRGRPSVIAPAGLGAALQQAGAIVVLLAPDAEQGYADVLRTLDALVVFDDAEHLGALRDAARRCAVTLLVLDAVRPGPDAPAETFAPEIAGLFVPGCAGSARGLREAPGA